VLLRYTLLEGVDTLVNVGNVRITFGDVLLGGADPLVGDSYTIVLVLDAVGISSSGAGHTQKGGHVRGAHGQPDPRTKGIWRSPP